MESSRKHLLVPARIGSLEFIAKGVSGPRARRIAKDGSVGMDGQFTADLGEDARTDQIQAVLTEDQWMELDAIRRKGEVLSIVHPLFGSFQGRVESAPYQAGLRDKIETTITVIEDAGHIPAPPPRTSPTNAAAKLRAATGMLSDTLAMAPEDGALDLADLAAGAVALVAAGEAMADLVDGGLSLAGDLWHAATDAYSDVTDAVSDIASAGRELAGVVSDVMDTALDVVDQTWTIAARARDCLDAVVDSVSSTWSAVTVGSIRSLDAILREAVGEVTDDLIGMVLAANPHVTDPLMVPPGVTLQIPRGAA